jgi:hypothetical protein
LIVLFFLQIGASVSVETNLFCSLYRVIFKATPVLSLLLLLSLYFLVKINKKTTQ